MFGIGLPELIIIMAVALMVIGPKKLPDLARALGKGMAEFRKATQDIKESLDIDEDLQDVKNDLADSISGLESPMEPAGSESTFENIAGYEEFGTAPEPDDKSSEEEFTRKTPDEAAPEENKTDDR